MVVEVVVTVETVVIVMVVMGVLVEGVVVVMGPVGVAMVEMAEMVVVGAVLPSLNHDSGTVEENAASQHQLPPLFPGNRTLSVRVVLNRVLFWVDGKLHLGF